MIAALPFCDILLRSQNIPEQKQKITGFSRMFPACSLFFARNL